MFARYSRWGGTLRRLYLDEFAGEADPGARPFDGDEGERAAGLYERVFIGYGDDSIAQVGGAHLACEWTSNVLTKVLQRGRLAAYLEQSTRYIAYDEPMPGGGYRFYSDDDLGLAYREAMDSIFARLLGRPSHRHGVGRRAMAPRRGARGRLAQLDPREGAGPPARALARLDAQPRRHLRLRPGLRAASPAALCLPPSRSSRVRLDDPRELRHVIPSFVARVDRPERGGEWISFLQDAPRDDGARGRPPWP